jgi:hypothetical protein
MNYEWDIGDEGLFYPQEVVSTELNGGITIKGIRRHAVYDDNNVLDCVEEEEICLDVVLLEDEDITELERLKQENPINTKAIFELLNKAGWEWYALW